MQFNMDDGPPGVLVASLSLITGLTPVIFIPVSQDGKIGVENEMIFLLCL